MICGAQGLIAPSQLSDFRPGQAQIPTIGPQRGSCSRILEAPTQPSTLNPQPSTLNPQPSTLNPQPSTFDPHPSTHSKKLRGQEAVAPNAMSLELLASDALEEPEGQLTVFSKVWSFWVLLVVCRIQGWGFGFRVESSATGAYGLGF